ncbi:methylated-DNA--[protein]-cysteine S-methyltransferase [Rhizohabitans arisaemae]|uniref:methylated-DNA--[protein]-cysteine S-methyltransferase n=1 Tax=Rhizohabitans arisaemae TaxID=2720610 RepID=UPI0024B10E0B|nr:methylated-DNA--[protein]-cysteine S-methyltransferase [Rhizohabitans arisaemae]
MGETVAFGRMSTPLGEMLIGVTEDGVVSTGWGDPDRLRARALDSLGLPEADDPARTAPVLTELAAYYAGELKIFGVPLDWRLFTPIQHRVLGTLYERVAYGKAVTYGELAAMSGTGVPARAIGSIMGANPIPVIVPCHRVVAGNGLGGFSGGEGVAGKRRLLTLEGYLQPTLDWDEPIGLT